MDQHISQNQTRIGGQSFSVYEVGGRGSSECKCLNEVADFMATEGLDFCKAPHWW